MEGSRCGRKERRLRLSPEKLLFGSAVIKVKAAEDTISMKRRDMFSYL